MLHLTYKPWTIFYSLILTQAILTTRNAVNPNVTKHALGQRRRSASVTGPAMVHALLVVRRKLFPNCADGLTQWMCILLTLMCFFPFSCSPRMWLFWPRHLYLQISKWRYSMRWRWRLSQSRHLLRSLWKCVLVLELKLSVPFLCKKKIILVT